MTDRIVDRLLDLEVPLERHALLSAARAVAGEVAPLATDDDLTTAVDTLVGMGPIEGLLRDPTVSDVLVNGADDVWIEREGRLVRTGVRFPDDRAIVAAVERMIAPLGLRLDRARPAVDARLPDGSRIHAIVPPAAVDGPVVAIRRFTQAVPDVEALVAAGAVRADGARLLTEAVEARHNILVAGQTGSGKTTLLNVLGRLIDPAHRIVTVEDAAELSLDGHVIRLEGRPPNAEGVGEIDLRTLLRHALRLRPDRIVVGEVRGAEAFDMVQALSTGHRGSMSTIHASGPEAALWRLEMLALAGAGTIDPRLLRRQIRAAIDVVVFMSRTDGSRIVHSIVAVDDDGITERYRC